MFLRAIPIAGFGVALLLLASLNWPSGSAPTASALTNCDAVGNPDTYALDMFVLINNARVANGAFPLKWSPNLNRAAAWMSTNSAYGPLSHTDSLGRDPFQRMSDCGYPGGYRGENVGKYTHSAQVMFDEFMGSAGHKANILDTNFRVVGIAEYNSYWTLDFGSLDDSGLPDGPPPVYTATPTGSATATNTPTNTATPTKTATKTPTKTPTPSGPRPRAFIPMIAGEEELIPPAAN